MRTLTQYLKKKFAKDKGDAVLVTSVIAVPLLCLCFAFATSISLGTWQQTSYRSAAQAAATSSLQSVAASGYLNEATAKTFLREYRGQTGRNLAGVAGQGSGAKETGSFQSTNCTTAAINGKTRTLPYIEIQLDSVRRSGVSAGASGTFTAEGPTGALKKAGTILPNGAYRVINVRVWEASQNVTWFGVRAETPRDMTCQAYATDVSAILFGNNEDL